MLFASPTSRKADMSGIHSDITSAFGNTPLVKLNRIAADVDATLLAKLEFYNPRPPSRTASALPLWMPPKRQACTLPAGGTIIEATSGNGIALAMVGAARGYKVILTMPASMSKERRLLLKAYGAELVLTDPTLGMGCTRRS